jgi:hypothetical protein
MQKKECIAMKYAIRSPALLKMKNKRRNEKMNIVEKIEANFAPPSCLDGMRFDLSKKMWEEIKAHYIEVGKKQAQPCQSEEIK